MGTIQANLTIRYKDNKYQNESLRMKVKSDWNGSNYILQTLTTNTTWKTLKSGSVINSGVLYIENIGLQDIDVTFDGTTNTLQMKPHEYYLLKLHPDFPVEHIKVKSNTESRLEYLFLEHDASYPNIYGVGKARIGSSFIIN